MTGRPIGRNVKLVSDGTERRRDMGRDLEGACASIRKAKRTKRGINLLNPNADGKLTPYWEKRFNEIYGKW